MIAPSHIVTYANRQESDTAAEWTRVNPILAAGVPGTERDTGKMKVGDGATAWINLRYVSTGGGSSDTSALQAQLTAHIDAEIAHGTVTPIAEIADLPSVSGPELSLLLMGG
jgi:hypothetical protein